MIHVDESEPIGDLEQSFAPRDVLIKRGVDAKDAYEMVTEIGRGKFGTVFRCREKATGLQLAAKFVPIPKRDDRRNVEREVELMNSLQHTLIIQLYDALEYQKMMCVVLELVEGGELFDRVIDDDFVLTERACAVFVRQVCQAMEFVHRNNIIHLDLKPENILCLTREGNRIKIIDFGLARKFDPDKKLQVLFGTPEFVAPEVVNFDQISFGTDMWSVGVICYVLLSGLSPFMGGTDVETMANVTIGKYDFDDEAFAAVSKDALDFIGKLLVKDSSIRLTAAQCLTHKWLKRRTGASTKAKAVKHKTAATAAVAAAAQTPDGQQTPVRRKSSTSGAVGTPGKIASGKIAADAIAAAAATNGGDTVISCSNNNNNNSSSSISANADTNGNGNSSNGDDGGVDSGCGVTTMANDNDPAVVDGGGDNNAELKATKDNLKSFIERWEEHPNSPYVFDTDTHCISPVMADELLLLDPITMPVQPDATGCNGLADSGTCSVLSSRGCSPSPCESLGSDLLPNSIEDSTLPPPLPASQPPHSARIPLHRPNSCRNDEVNDDADDDDPKRTHMREYLQTFERRHSDGERCGEPTADEKVNLADEIKRLSERLMMLSSSLSLDAPQQLATPQDGDRNNNHPLVADEAPLKPALKPKPEFLKNKTRTSLDEHFAQQLAQHTETVTTRRAFQRATTTHRTATSSSFSTNSAQTFTRASSVMNTSCTGGAASTLRSDRLSARLQLLDDMPTINRAGRSITPMGSVESAYESTAAFFGQSIDRGRTTSTRRTKFRVSQMSRDVPVGRPDTHQAIFLEEAVTTTKDCLLQLLDKYNGGERTDEMPPASACSGISSTERRTAFGRHRSQHRHQSLSFGAGCGSGGLGGVGLAADSVEQRSMNSLNFFFQRHAVAGNTVRQMQAQLESKRRQL